MVLLIIPIFLILVGFIWLLKGPVAKSATSLQEDGSSKREAYVIIIVLGAGLMIAIYMIIQVI